MKKLLVLISIIISTISILYANLNIKSKLVNLQTSHQKDTTKSTFKVNNKKVSEKEFNGFLSTLKDLPNTWYCKEMYNGGATGYDAIDKHKTVYEVCLSMKSDVHINTITKKSLSSHKK